MGTALLVTDSGNTSDDSYVNGRLVALGYTVTAREDSLAVPSDINTYDLVVISESVAGSSAPGGTYKNVAVPLLSMEQFCTDEMGLSTGGQTTAGTGSIVVIDDTHPIMVDAGLSNGTHLVSTRGTPEISGAPSPVGDRLANIATATTYAAVWAIDTGTSLYGGGTAAAKRVVYSPRQATYSSHNSDGDALFDAIIEWLDPSPSGTAHTASITDDIGLTDSGDYDYGEAFNELGLTDSVSYDHTVSTAFTRSITDDIGPTDAISQASDTVVELSDDLGIQDLISTVSDHSREVVDATSLTDTPFTVVGVQRVVSDDVGVEDWLSTSHAYRLELSDGLDITDLVASSATFAREIDDQQGLADTSEYSGGAQSITYTISDSLHVSEPGNIYYSGSDAFDATDTLSVPAASYDIVFTDTFTVTDLDDDYLLEVGYVADEPMGLSDSTSHADEPLENHTRTITDNLLVFEPTSSWQFSGADELHSSDTLTQSRTYGRVITDDTSLSDVSDRFASPRTQRARTDTIFVTDPMTFVLSTHFHPRPPVSHTHPPHPDISHVHGRPPSDHIHER